MAEVHLPIPFDAYDGDGPFIFVSYAHRDGARVYPELKVLHTMGYRIWYDEGIDPGNEWPEEIAKALDSAALFLVFISGNAVASKNVKNEINFALNRGKLFLAIYLEETSLPGGLELRMGDIQAIMRWRMDEAHYFRKVQRALPGSLRDGARSLVERQPESTTRVSPEPPHSSTNAADPEVSLRWFTSKTVAVGEVDLTCTRCGYGDSFGYKTENEHPPESCPRCGLGAGGTTGDEGGVHVFERWRANAGSQDLTQIAWTESKVFMKAEILSSHEGYVVTMLDRTTGEVLNTHGGFVDPDLPLGRPSPFVPEESFPEYPKLTWERVEAVDRESKDWAWTIASQARRVEFARRDDATRMGAWSVTGDLLVSKVMPGGMGDLIIVLAREGQRATEVVLINLS